MLGGRNLLYSKKESPDGVFTCVKNNPISKCDNHEIIEITQEGKWNYHFITYKCSVHDEVVKRAKGHVLSKGCVPCSRELLRKKREGLFLKHLSDDKQNDEFELVSKYINAKESVWMKHLTCNREFPTTPDKFIGAYNCPHCTNSMYQIKTFQDYVLKYQGFYNSEGFQIVQKCNSKNITAQSSFEVKHMSCGTTRKITHDEFHNKGSRCKVCNNKNSRVHAIVCATLNVNNLNYEPEYRFEDCKNKYPLPFDFKVNLPDSKFVLIEVDGQQHYRQMGGIYNGKFSYIKKNDKIKNEYCKDNNFKLHRVKVEDFTTIESVFSHLQTIIPISKIPTFSEVDKLNTNKLSYKQAHQIRQLYLQGVGSTELSKEYDVTPSWIRKLLNFQTYPDDPECLKTEIKQKLILNSNKPPRRSSKLLPNKKEILKLHSDGWSYNKIGREYDANGSTVRKFIINHKD